MKVHVQIPHALDKNFGRALNEEFERIPDGDWMCVIDHDILLGLTPNAIEILHGYAERHPDAMLTCLTNRVGNKNQLMNGVISGNDSIRHWINVADKQRKYGFKTTELPTSPSGFLLLISKQMWNDVGHFTEDKQILGVDNHFGDKVLNKGFKILRMDGLVVFHIYRLLQGKHDKSHLK